MMLFKDRKDYLAFKEPCLAGQVCERPVCISGIFAGDPPLGLSNHNGERVTVKGRLISYRSLPYEDAPFLRRKIYADRVVMDYCLRDEVILITSVTPD